MAEPPPQAASSLAAEVKALDLARAALARGEPGEALSQLEHYRHDFPRGELAQEAEVLTLEALAAKGEKASVVSAADVFLHRHPNAPQAARVRQLRAGAVRRPPD